MGRGKRGEGKARSSTPPTEGPEVSCYCRTSYKVCGAQGKVWDLGSKIKTVKKAIAEC